MTSVGYGDMTAQNFFGQVCIVIAAAMGVIFDGIFVISWLSYVKMTKSEEDAFVLIMRIQSKNILRKLLA
jgi:hypothetical protein